MNKTQIAFLLGPTAIGKTNLAIQLAERYPYEIISVDSAMVYRGLNIGTAKPSAEELAKTPQHLIDLCDPTEPYSAAQFCLDVKPIIDDIDQRGKMPLLVGGTMLYFRALQFGLSKLPEADDTLRAKISQQAEVLGWPVMHRQLAMVDSQAASQIKPTDSQRIQRALEIYQLTGKTRSELWRQTQQRCPYDVKVFALVPQDRTWLHQQIAKRFELMLQAGFLDEVRALYHRGDLDLSLPAIRSVGYRQLWQHLEGEFTLEQAIEKAIVATRQLAKRQLTWIRSWPGVVCLEVSEMTGKSLVKTWCPDTLRSL